jgi:hypothetical protein
MSANGRFDGCCCSLLLLLPLLTAAQAAQQLPLLAVTIGCWRL